MADVLAQHPEMNTELTDFAFVLPKTQTHFKSIIRPGFRQNLIRAIADSWTYALERGAVVCHDGYVVFQVFGQVDTSELRAVTISPNQKPGGHPWIVVVASGEELDELRAVAVTDDLADLEPQGDPQPKPTPPPAPAPAPKPTPTPAPAPAPSGHQGAKPSSAKDLKEYAFIWIGKSDEHHVSALEQIAAQALPETWGFGKGDYSILGSYIIFTFYKLRRDGKVLENKDRTFAAMNTGLVTPRYEDLYLCFVPNDHPTAKQPWKYAGVCTQFDNNNKLLSAQLRESFPKMPERARFFTDVSDIVFDASREIVCNWDHIIIENIDRIPTDFIASQLYGKQATQIREMVESIDYDPDQGTAGDPYANHATGSVGERFDELRDFLRTNPMYFNRIRGAVEAALDRAKVRAAYSFRTGVPSFYPGINRIQILLPLCLMDEDEPDCALVTSKDAHGNYEGRTILTLRMAYKNARLLCRPESEWLSV